MVTKKKIVKKISKPKNKHVEEDLDEAMGVDDALAGLDDGDVESAPSKPRVIKKKNKLDEEMDEVEDEVETLSRTINGAGNGDPVNIRASKPVDKIKKGDKITIDGKVYEVDGHYVLIDHGSTKEMTIEIFDPKADRDYQIRYFNDQIETTLEFYELQEIVYVRKPMKTISW